MAKRDKTSRCRYCGARTRGAPVCSACLPAAANDPAMLAQYPELAEQVATLQIAPREPGRP